MKNIVIGFLCALLPVAASATGEFGVALRVGTLGLGLQAATSVMPKLNIRGGIQRLTADLDTDADDIEYEFEVEFFTVSALADYHLWDGGFRLSGGLMLNNNELDAIGSPKNITYKIGSREYTLEDVGTLRGHMEFSPLAPYLGVGWGNIVGQDKRWGLVCDLGVMIQGSPDVEFSANGLIAQDADFIADLREEEASAKDDLEGFQVWPVISLGVSYRFF